MIRAADLFCGAGGASTGLQLAAARRGLDLDLVAINHWRAAVNTHEANHPNARLERSSRRGAVLGHLVDSRSAGEPAEGCSVKLDFKDLVKAAAEGRLGPVRDHFTACDGFEATQDLARLVDTLVSFNVPAMWQLLQSIHRWQR